MKYIIESNDVIGYTPKYAMLFGDGYMIQPLEDLEVLNSDYINEHFGDLQDEAYQKGFEDGKWKSEDGCTGCKYEGKTGEHLPCDYCMNNFKNQWTAKDDKIEVGDVVIAEEGKTVGIVTKEWDSRYYVMWQDGSSGLWLKESVRKTGRHFDIDKILDEMKGTGTDDDTY